MIYKPERLEGVHVDLVLVMQVVGKYRDFIITSGLRTREQQHKMVLIGASKTMNSRHLTGHAVDVALLINEKVSWDFADYERFNTVVQDHAIQLKIPITWGGIWPKLRDGPHFELDRKAYPTCGHPSSPLLSV